MYFRKVTAKKVVYHSGMQSKPFSVNDPKETTEVG